MTVVAYEANNKEIKLKVRDKSAIASSIRLVDFPLRSRLDSNF